MVQRGFLCVNNTKDVVGENDSACCSIFFFFSSFPSSYEYACVGFINIFSLLSDLSRGILNGTHALATNINDKSLRCQETRSKQI